MLFAILFVLALGITIWRKSRAKLAAGHPYVFSWWDGGLLLAGEEWEPKHTIWIGRALVALAAVCVAVPPVVAANEWRTQQIRQSAGPCAQVLTAAELREAGFPEGNVIAQSYVPKRGCRIAYPDSFSLEMGEPTLLKRQNVKPVPGVVGAEIYTLYNSRHLSVTRGTTLDLMAPYGVSEKSLQRLAAIAASRPEAFESL